MTNWTSVELTRIGDAEELRVASLRGDGTLRPFVTIWVVRVDDNLYVRSAYGADNPWFRRAKASGSGRIRAGTVERDITFAEHQPDSDDAIDAIDAAYHAKYDRHGAAIVATVTGPVAASNTLRLLPRES